jgi:predicted Holliday junction resolvase-like endonuclease
MAFLGVLIVLLIFLILVIYSLLLLKNREIKALEEIHKELIFSHRSQKVKHGKSFEQLFPFMNSYPYNHSNFRFIGSPIDGLSFEEDAIVFLEFKTGKSRLSNKQKKIKKMIKSKKVKWKEIRDD